MFSMDKVDKTVVFTPVPQLSLGCWDFACLVRQGEHLKNGVKTKSAFLFSLSLSMIFNRSQPLLLSAQHRSTVKFAFLCLLHYNRYQGLCSATTTWQFCSGKRDPMLLLHRHSNTNRSKILVASLKCIVTTCWMCWGKALLKQRESTRWFHLGSSRVPVWKPCMLYWCPGVLTYGFLRTYRRRKKNLKHRDGTTKVGFQHSKSRRRCSCILWKEWEAPPKHAMGLVQHADRQLQCLISSGRLAAWHIMLSWLRW